MIHDFINGNPFIALCVVVGTIIVVAIIGDTITACVSAIANAKYGRNEEE